MVFFNCNACGEALKKNQVEKHLLRCRQCQALSCVDCGKDFWGNDYQKHTKCMTEDEKYCGKGYVPKVNKGEAKQEQWIEKVQDAIEKSASNPKLKGLLERLKDYPNIPRKKAKFENFLKNSLRVLSQSLIAQVWETLMSATGQNQGTCNGQTAPGHNDKPANGNLARNDNDTALSTGTLDDSEVPLVNSSEPTDQKISKRDRKEERRQKTSKKEKKDKNIEIKQEERESKGKKRKFSETENNIQTETVLVDSSDVQEKKKKKKKKKQHVEEGENSESVVNGSSNNGTTLGEVNAEDESNEPVKKKKKMKFDWEATVLAVLKSKGELSLKRLRKKVLQEFAAQDAANYSEENLNAKFEKKVKKMSGIKVQKDRVRLK